MPSTRNSYTRFEQVFREHYNHLANYAFTILKSAQDSEDVVQEVFIRIWQNNPDVLTSEQVKFYLITATRNGCISFLRKQAGKTFVDPEAAGLQSTPDEERGEEQDLAGLVEKALAQLPPQCGVIFKLSRFGKLTYQQIADELNLSVKTVENQMGKALRMMRDYAKKNSVLMIGFLLLIGM